MFYRMPSYYNQFKCVADKCPESCCAGWAIVIDDKTMDKYESLSVKDRDYIESHIDMGEQCFKRCNGRCAFLNEQKLCELIINYGEDKLCKTCTRYPRHFEEYGNLVEAALSLSCPEAARIILTNPAYDRNLVRKTDRVSPHSKEVDYVLLGCLLDVRKHLFEIISDRSISVDARMKWMLKYSAKMQKPVYAYEKYGFRRKIKKAVATFLVGMDTLTNNDRNRFIQYKSKYINNESNNIDSLDGTNELDNSVCILSERYKILPQYIDMLLGLEAINDEWPELIQNIKHALYDNLSEEKYCAYSKEFTQYMKDREYEYEHILYYFIYTYFLGGVYDYNIQAMVKFAIISTIIIREMGLYTWLINDKACTIDSQIRNSCLFSRQIEHSDENLMALEGILNVHPIFSEANLIRIL